jgi:hypothetical protein
MADVFEALLGSVPPDQQALIEGLRKRAAYGQLAAASGIGPLAKVGATDVASARNEAETISNARRTDANREEERAFRKWQQEQATEQRGLDRTLREQMARDAAGLRRDLAMQDAEAKRAPAREKAAAVAAVKEEGKRNVDDVVATLRDHYDFLDKRKAIVNPSRGALPNIMARISASGPGQFVEGALGTDAQSSRDSIKQTRPILLQAIKNATGMSAQQMNSNVELRLWLDAATDPSISVKANRQALDNIEKWLGGGAPMVAPAEPAPSPAADEAAAKEARYQAWKAQQK